VHYKITDTKQYNDEPNYNLTLIQFSIGGFPLIELHVDGISLCIIYWKRHFWEPISQYPCQYILFMNAWEYITYLIVFTLIVNVVVSPYIHVPVGDIPWWNLCNGQCLQIVFSKSFTCNMYIFSHDIV